MADLPTPISRQDELLHNIADGTPDISTLDPLSREEEYLKYIALNGGGGGGGGDITVVQTTGTSTTSVMSQNAVSTMNVIGSSASRTDTGSVVFGDDATAQGTVNVTIGKQASSVNAASISVGYKAKANTGSCISIGRLAAAGKAGSSGVTGGDSCISIGENTTSVGDNCISIGSSADTVADRSIAIGSDAYTTAAGEKSIALGYNSVASEPYVLSVGSSGTTRKIVNVKNPTNPQDAATKNYVDPVTLYENTAGTAGTIPLSDTYTNYSLIRIHFLDNNVCNAVDLATTSYRAGLANTYIASDAKIIYIHSCLLSFSGTTATFERNSIASINSSSGNIDINAPFEGVYVTKIVGYKY